MSGSDQDHGLVLRSKAGDNAALDTLLARHGRAVRTIIERSIPRRWVSVLSAEDVMQQAYLDAIKSIGEFDYCGPGSFRAWLTTIAKNNLNNATNGLEAAKRGGGRKRILPSSLNDSYIALFDFVGVTSKSPSHCASRQEAYAAIHAALEKLPEHYRIVIERAELQGQPMDEVAKEINRSLGSCYMIRTRALEVLARNLGSSAKYLTTVGHDAD
jgi:RNA polymerase sigma factor (sigma-70 family)